MTVLIDELTPRDLGFALDMSITHCELPPPGFPRDGD